jgi:hypothetical protein
VASCSQQASTAVKVLSLGGVPPARASSNSSIASPAWPSSASARTAAFSTITPLPSPLGATGGAPAAARAAAAAATSSLAAR